MSACSRIVLDNGSGILKAGLASQDWPKAVAPNCMGQVRKKAGTVYYGEGVFTVPDYFCHRPHSQGLLVDVDMQRDIWQWIFAKNTTTGAAVVGSGSGHDGSGEKGGVTGGSSGAGGSGCSGGGAGGTCISGVGGAVGSTVGSGGTFGTPCSGGGMVNPLGGGTCGQLLGGAGLNIRGNYGEFGICVTEPYLNLAAIRYSISEIVFEDFGFKELLLLPAIHAAPFAFFDNFNSLPPPFGDCCAAATAKRRFESQSPLQSLVSLPSAYSSFSIALEKDIRRGQNAAGRTCGLSAGGVVVKGEARPTIAAAPTSGSCGSFTSSLVGTCRRSPNKSRVSSRISAVGSGSNNPRSLSSQYAAGHHNTSNNSRKGSCYSLSSSEITSTAGVSTNTAGGCRLSVIGSSVSSSNAFQLFDPSPDSSPSTITTCDDSCDINWLTVTDEPSSYGMDFLKQSNDYLLNNDDIFSGSTLLRNPCCLVADCGFSYTSVMPFFEYSPLDHCSLRTDVGGTHLNAYMKNLLCFRHLNLEQNELLVQHIKEESCYVALDFVKEMKMFEKVKAKNVLIKDNFDEISRLCYEYELPDYNVKNKNILLNFFSTNRNIYMQKPTSTHINSYFVHHDDDYLTKDLMKFDMNTTHISEEKDKILLCNERISVPEILFNPQDVGMRECGVAELVYRCINRIPLEIRPFFSQQIILIGGSSKFKGFKERLYKELRAMLPQTWKVCIYQDNDPSLSVWRGMKNFVANDFFFDKNKITKEQYNENGSIRIL